MIAAARVIQGERARLGKFRQPHLLDDFRQRDVRLAAIVAKRAQQALRLNADDGRGQQVILDAHVEQAVERGRSVIGVQRRQHQVSCQRRLHGNLRGLEIADFPDHDDVRILPHDRTQCIGERQVDLRPDLDLVDAGHLIFDRILDRQDLHIGTIERVERRV